MRTYNDTINMIAEQSLNAYLAGTDHRPVGSYVIAFAYGVEKRVVEQDLHNAFYDQLHE